MNQLEGGDICILFAVKHEAALFRKRLKNRQRFILRTFPVVTGQWSNCRVLTVCVGMGVQSAQKRLDELLNFIQPQNIILAGYAGALTSDLRVGDVVVSDENFCAKVQKQVSFQLQTGNCISIEELAAESNYKQRLHEQTGAVICDMEWEYIRDRLLQINLKANFIRGVSDAVYDFLPKGALLASYDLQQQKPTPGRLLFYLITHPVEVLPFFRFVSHLPLVRKNMTLILCKIIESFSLNNLQKKNGEKDRKE